MSSSPVRQVFPLARAPWPTVDPFLFVAYHLDDYPAGNDAMGPKGGTGGRKIGMDFADKEGWNMYHGDTIPGFPRHPHRGFETVTVVRSGYVDHSDSLGASARFGNGDAQWMTAGRGIVHSEMFPLLEQSEGNPAELFQVWLNLPSRSKMVEPHFAMLWGENIPSHERDGVIVRTVAGPLDGKVPPQAPPHSWASEAGSNVAIWTIEMPPGTRFEIPASDSQTGRTLYFFRGTTIELAGTSLAVRHGALLDAAEPMLLENTGAEQASLLMLQGRPIGEPVAHHGPFVMNTRAELSQAIADYRETSFGPWPWSRDGPVHTREQGRFARHSDGRHDVPGQESG